MTGRWRAAGRTRDPETDRSTDRLRTARQGSTRQGASIVDEPTTLPRTLGNRGMRRVLSKLDGNRGAQLRGAVQRTWVFATESREEPSPWVYYPISDRYHNFETGEDYYPKHGWLKDNEDDANSHFTSEGEHEIIMDEIEIPPTSERDCFINDETMEVVYPDEETLGSLGSLAERQLDLFEYERYLRAIKDDGVDVTDLLSSIWTELESGGLDEDVGELVPSESGSGGYVPPHQREGFVGSGAVLQLQTIPQALADWMRRQVMGSLTFRKYRGKTPDTATTKRWYLDEQIDLTSIGLRADHNIVVDIHFEGGEPTGIGSVWVQGVRGANSAIQSQDVRELETLYNVWMNRVGFAYVT